MTFPHQFSRIFGLLAALLPVALSGCASSDQEAGLAEGDSDRAASGGSSQAEIEDLYENGLVIGDGDSGSGSGQGGASVDSSACLSVLSLGTVGRHGSVPGEDGQDAIIAWLNERSNAVARHVLQPTEITAEFLAPFDVIMLQNLEGWTFSHEEALIFEKWVRTGGGVLALAGYMSDAGAEVLPTNELLSFSGMKFNPLSTAGDTSTSLGVCGYCLGTTYRQAGFEPKHPISQGVSAVGAFQGRSINGDGQLVASEGDVIFGMSKEIDQGRVFLFHDDWVTYNSQWSSGTVSGCEENSECAGMSPRETYQVPQFWYNSLRFLAPSATCFDVQDDSIVRDL